MKTILMLTTMLYFFFFVSTIAIGSPNGNSPKLNNGKKWEIAYYEGGPYSEYTDTMRTFIDGLIELGWITNNNHPFLNAEIETPYKEWLITNAGKFLSFKKENFYSSNWDPKQRVKSRKEMIAKLQKKEIDFVIAMGTWAGLDLANNEHSVPVMILSTSDPLGAGIIKSENDSGFDHVTARVDPNRYLRQLRMFHRIVNFKKLGIAYEDTEEGRSYSAIKEAKYIAKERGFELITCKINENLPDDEQIKNSCLRCFEILSERTDAIYLTALRCADSNTGEIADFFKKERMPSFSMIGSKWVKEGIMMSISSDSGYTELSRYSADKFGKILNGMKPRSITQLCEDPLEIAINMETIRKTGFDMPLGIIKVATEIYED